MSMIRINVTENGKQLASLWASENLVPVRGDGVTVHKDGLPKTGSVDHVIYDFSNPDDIAVEVQVLAVQ